MPSLSDQAAAAGSSTAIVLVVDRSAALRVRVSAVLGQRGWRVIEAVDLEQAAELCREITVDVVLLELELLGSNGLAHCLPEGGKGNPIPVVALIRRASELAVTLAARAGAVDFFVVGRNHWPLLSARLRAVLRKAKLREELVAGRQRLSKIQRLARLGTWDWDIGRRWVWLSSQACAIAGLPEREQGLSEGFVWSRFEPEDRARIVELFESAAERHGALSFEVPLARSDGRLCVIQVEAEVEYDELDRPWRVQGVLLDVTQRRQAEARIHELRCSDMLTGLANRRQFRELLGGTIAAAREQGCGVGVIFLGLDRFKQINDTLGHHIGDQLLREVAQRLKRWVRNQVSTAVGMAGGPGLARLLAASVDGVARFGGDEFSVLALPVDDPVLFENQARELLAEVCGAYSFLGHEIFVTASAGLASYPRDGADADTVLRKADIAMVAVKASGRNGLLRFSEALKPASAERVRLETGLNRAIERAELVLHYQPKVDVASGQIVGAEALIRWQRGTQLLPPSEFIALAEESGLIVPMTEWAVRDVCRQITEWRAAGLAPVPVAVNVSGRHLQRANLTEPVRSALAEFGVTAALLELELTETVLMQNLAVGLPLLHSLKELGVRLAIDDFGTGYSSLAYLKRLPIDALKIDRSFVRDLEAGADNAAIVAAIIAMASSLRLSVVAEGVETRGQMALLHAQGCSRMQGFFFAPAVPAQKFAELLARPAPRPEWLAAPRVAAVTRVATRPSGRPLPLDPDEDLPGIA